MKTVNTDLLKVALEISKNDDTIIRKSTKFNINNRLVDILCNQKRKLSKTQIIVELSLERLDFKFKNKLTKEMFLTDEVQKEFKSIKMTVQNGFEQSYSKGQNNASFHYNEKFNGYKLNRDEDDIFTIVKVKTETNK